MQFKREDHNQIRELLNQEIDIHFDDDLALFYAVTP